MSTEIFETNILCCIFLQDKEVLKKVIIPKNHYYLNFCLRNSACSFSSFPSMLPKDLTHKAKIAVCTKPVDMFVLDLHIKWSIN